MSSLLTWSFSKAGVLSFEQWSLLEAGPLTGWSLARTWWIQSQNQTAGPWRRTGECRWRWRSCCSSRCQSSCPLVGCYIHCNGRSCMQEQTGLGQAFFGGGRVGLLLQSFLIQTWSQRRTLRTKVRWEATAFQTPDKPPPALIQVLQLSFSSPSSSSSSAGLFAG